MSDDKDHWNHVGKDEAEVPDPRGCKEYRANECPENEHNRKLPGNYNVLNTAGDMVPVLGLRKRSLKLGDSIRFDAVLFFDLNRLRGLVLLRSPVIYAELALQLDFFVRRVPTDHEVKRGENGSPLSSIHGNVVDALNEKGDEPNGSVQNGAPDAVVLHASKRKKILLVESAVVRCFDHVLMIAQGFTQVIW